MKGSKQTVHLKFRAVNRDIFNAIKKGKKKVETRAATEKYRKIRTGDILKLICGKERFTKSVKKVVVVPSITALLKKYRPQEVNPVCKNAKEIRRVYYSFPDYKEKIKKFGIIALELK